MKIKSDFIGNLRIAIEKGLTQANALDALTITPARLIGVQRSAWFFRKRDKIANFIICSSNIFTDGIIYENWTAGKKNIVTKKITEDIRGYYSFHSDEFNNIPVEITGKKEKPNYKNYIKLILVN